MKNRVLAYCRENNMLQPGELLTVAVSGGCDSMALLQLMLELQGELGITLQAAHYNHALRGTQSDGDEAFVREWCRKCSVPLLVGRGDVRQRAQTTGESVEEAARKLRYAFLQEAGGKLATAHHAQDNAETVLLHLLRGTGLRGLGGIAPVRGNIIRPLLPFTRQELEAYLREKGIPWVEDATNAEDGCVRNRLRHELLPILERENPSIYRTLFNTAAMLRQEDEYLSRLAKAAAEACRVPGGYDCARLRQTEPVLLQRILLRLLTDTGAENPSSAHVQALQRLIFSDNPSASCSLPGFTAQRQYALLRICAAEETVSDIVPTALKIPGQTVLQPSGRRITVKFTKNSNFFKNTTTTLYLRYDMISENLWTVRSRQTGDRLRLPGGSKSVKKLLIDRRIPSAERALLPVFICDGQLAAVAGLGVDMAFTPKQGEQAIVITIQKEG